MKNTNLSETVIQVFFFPFYYIRYAYLTNKNLNISLEKTPTKDEFIYHIIHTFIGILTINFFIFIFRELDIFELNYNIIINNIYAIVVYLQGFLFLLSYTLILSAFLLFHIHSFKADYINRIFLFCIKIFNIFFPVLILVLIYIVQFFLLGKHNIDMHNVSTWPLFFAWAVFFFVIVWFRVGIILLVNTKKLLLNYYQTINIFFKICNRIYIVPILIMLMSGWINYHIVYKVTPDVAFEKLIHKDNLCIEVLNYQLYKTNWFDNQEVSFEDYQKRIKECQKINPK